MRCVPRRDDRRGGRHHRSSLIHVMGFYTTPGEANAFALADRECRSRRRLKNHIHKQSSAAVVGVPVWGNILRRRHTRARTNFFDVSLLCAVHVSVLADYARAGCSASWSAERIATAAARTCWIRVRSVTCAAVPTIRSVANNLERSSRDRLCERCTAQCVRRRCFRHNTIARVCYAR